ncbi:MAG: radical SAM protein, partial [Candidatus Cloacimonetes bacterium]|nr:radical SAM protein [Candidatus Cloacimonadota bacterium]
MRNRYRHLVKKTTTFKRLVNLVKIYSSYYLSVFTKKAFVWGYPASIMIEPTNICNLRCPLCPSGNGTLTRKRGSIDFKLFEKIVEELHDKIFMLFFWNQGEPFLHKNMNEMVRYAAERKIYTTISTN